MAMIPLLDLEQKYYSKFKDHNNFTFLTRAAVLLVTGSQAYGLAKPESDYDLVGVTIPPAKYLVGLETWEGWNPGPEDEDDFRAYSLRKYIKLLLSGNMNVVETLFFSEDCYLMYTTVFNQLRSMKQDFLTERLLKSIKGYANGQLQRMEHYDTTRDLGKKRKEAVEAHGYDIYHASHVVRLLETAQDWLETGEFVPMRRADSRDRILDIKTGKWALHDVIQYGEELFANVNLLEKEFEFSKTPYKRAQDLLINEHILTL